MVVIRNQDMSRIRRHCFWAVHKRQNLLPQHLFGGSDGVQSRVEQGDAVGERCDEINVMRYQKNCEVQVLVEMFDEIEDGVLGGGIDTRCWLVQKKHLRVLSERPSDEDPLLLT